MARTRTTAAAEHGPRKYELKRILEDHRRQLMQEVHERIRGARTDMTKGDQVLDEGEISEVDNQEDLEFALIQMKAETLNKIDAALQRLDDDMYGFCFECGREIAEGRLRALPFAVRCRDCEHVREMSDQRERSVARRGGASSLVVEF
jgi:DnaK suppressor protein